MRDAGHPHGTIARIVGRPRSLPLGRGLAVAALVAVACLRPGTGQAQVSPRMLQAANECLAGAVESCDFILGYARGACLFGNRFACRVAEEVRKVRARAGSASAGLHGGTAAAPGDARTHVRIYCSDPTLESQLRALNLCG